LIATIKQETARTLRDGYYQTGDQGYYDADGNLYVIGRYKELIKYRICHVIRGIYFQILILSLLINLF